jgi:hypothetical protein
VADVIQGHKFLNAFAKQSVEGTAVTTMEYAVPAYSDIVKPNEDRTPFEVMDGNAYRTGQFKSRADAGGTVELASFPDSIGRLLTAHLGSDTVTGTTNLTHTIVFNNTPQWLTWFTQRPLTGASVEWDKFTDCLVKTVELRYVAGQLFRVYVEILGKKATGNVSAPTITTTNVLTSAAKKHTWAGATLKLDVDATPAVTAINNLKSFVIHMGYDNASLEQTENLTPDFRDLGVWNLSMSADFLVQDWAAYKATYFGSKTASNADSSPLVIAGALDFTIPTDPTDANSTLQVLMPAVDFSLEAPAGDVSGKGLVVSLAGVTEQNATPITCKVKNQVAAAY